MANFSIQTIEYQDYDTDLIGISKDTFVDSDNPTWNWGGSSLLVCAFGTGVEKEAIPIVEMKMPAQEDILGADELFKVELGLYVQIPGSATPTGISIYNLPEPDSPWQEGTQTGGVGTCNYQKRDTVNDWSNFADHSHVYADGDIALTGIQAGPSQGFVWFDITKALNWSDRKSFYLRNLIDLLNKSISFASTESTPSSNHPKLKITYLSRPPEGFTEEDAKLRIQPNPDNPVQPLLTWGAVEAPDFKQYKLYRETVPITTVGALTPLATITDSAIEEYIDTAALTNGQIYYYRLIAEDQDNAGDNALLSATVFFTKPDVTTATLSPSGTQNVGTNVSVTVVSPQYIKKVFVDWKDDTVTPANDIQAWYEFETVALTQVASHIYMKHTNAGSVTPQVRIEDENGFWSDLESTGNTVRLDDIVGKAKLLVSVHKAIEGDDVTLNGAYSQPAAGNTTITKYEFKRFAADSWQDNGTDPIFTFSTAAFGTGTITASLRITTSTSLQDTDTTTYDLETGTPTEITPGVVGGLSNYTSIHELEHGLAQNKLVETPTGSDGVEHEFLLARRAERITIHATSDFPGRDADITIIRNAWLNNTFLRLVVPSEMDGFSVQYDFKLDGDVSIGHRFDNKLNWSFPIRVISRTEIADSPLNGAITAFSNPGGGKVQATSANHGLLNGMYVLITGTTNYDGTYQISNVTTNTFRFVATWVADDAMGLWRKVGEG